MKKFLAATLMIMTAVLGTAQTIGQTIINNEQYLVIDMISETNGYDNIQVLFNLKDAQAFNRKIARFSAVAEKIVGKAINEGKRNYRKAIAGTITSSNIRFNYDGATNLSDGYFMVPSLDIDAEGNCCLLLRGYYKGYNVTSSSESLVANDKIRYQQKCEYNYNMRIPIVSIERYEMELSCTVSSLSSESLACK